MVRSIRGTFSTGHKALGRNQVKGRRRVPGPAASTTAARSPTCGTLGAMEQRRWVNQTQPQTLQIAVFLLYLTAVFNFIDLLRIHAFPLPFVAGIVGSVAAGYGIANERK